MKSLLIVVGLAAACLAAEIPKNATVELASPPLAGSSTTPAATTTQSVNLRPEDLAVAHNTNTSDSLFPDIHLHQEGEHLPNVNVAAAPTYQVNSSLDTATGENLMDLTTKPTFIMKISTTQKPEGAHAEPHPEPEPSAEPEPTAEPGPSGHSKPGATTSKPSSAKPTSLPKTSGAATLSAPFAILLGAASVVVARLC